VFHLQRPGDRMAVLVETADQFSRTRAAMGYKLRRIGGRRRAEILADAQVEVAAPAPVYGKLAAADVDRLGRAWAAHLVSAAFNRRSENQFIPVIFKQVAEQHLEPVLRKG